MKYFFFVVCINVLVNIAAFSSVKLRASEYSYSLNSQFEDSDNLSGRQGGEEGNAKTVGLSFQLGSTNFREWELEFSGALSRVTYSDESLSDETIKEIETNLFYKPLQSNFTLFSLLNVGQAPINRFETQDVNNTRDELTFALRPFYALPLTRLDALNIGYSYVDYQLEDIESAQPFQISSNTTSSFLINYEKKINATNQFSLNLSVGETDFDDTITLGAIDYQQDDVFMRWVVTGQTNQLQVEYGTSKIVDELQQKLDIKLQRLSYSRQLNRDNSLELNYSKSFGNALNTNQSTNTTTATQQNILNTAQIVEDYSLTYTRAGLLLDITIDFSDSQIKQVFTSNVEQRKSVGLALTYRMSRLINNSGQSNVRLSYNKSESEFDTVRTNFVSNEIENYTFSYNYVYSSNLLMSLAYNVRDTMQLDSDQVDTPIESKSVSIRIVYGDRGRF